MATKFLDENGLTTLVGQTKTLIKREIPKLGDWALAPNKPVYTALEVGALPNTTKVVNQISELDDWQVTTIVTLNSISYRTFWKVEPSSSNQVYGIAINPDTGQLCSIYNNKGSYSVKEFGEDNEVFSSTEPLNMPKNSYWIKEY